MDATEPAARRKARRLQHIKETKGRKVFQAMQVQLTAREKSMIGTGDGPVTDAVGKAIDGALDLLCGRLMRQVWLESVTLSCFEAMGEWWCLVAVTATLDNGINFGFDE